MANEKIEKTPKQELTFKGNSIQVVECEFGAKDKAGSQGKQPTEDGEAHALNILLPAFEASETTSFDALGKEVAKMGSIFEAMAKGTVTPILEKSDGTRTEKMLFTIKEHPCSDAVSFFPRDIATPEALKQIINAGIRQYFMTRGGNRLKQQWSPESTGQQRGGLKNKSVDDIE